MYSYRQVTEEPRLIWEEYNLELLMIILNYLKV